MSDNKRLMQAKWNGVVVAESDDTVVVGGSHYFPRESIAEQYVVPSSHRSVCSWKGTASYLTLTVDGRRNRDAAWFYPLPLPAARQITGRVAFWKGVKVSPAAGADDAGSGGLLSRLRDRLAG